MGGSWYLIHDFIRTSYIRYWPTALYYEKMIIILDI